MMIEVWFEVGTMQCPLNFRIVKRKAIHLYGVNRRKRVVHFPTLLITETQKYGLETITNTIIVSSILWVPVSSGYFNELAFPSP